MIIVAPLAFFEAEKRERRELSLSTVARLRDA
jgi:hypothetical protein